MHGMLRGGDGSRHSSALDIALIILIGLGLFRFLWVVVAATPLVVRALIAALTISAVIVFGAADENSAQVWSLTAAVIAAAFLFGFAFPDD